MKSIDRIQGLKKSIKVVEAMPLFQKPAHLMPLVRELLNVLEQQSKDITRLEMIAEHIKTRGAP